MTALGTTTMDASVPGAPTVGAPRPVVAEVDGAEFDRLIVRTAARLRPALGPDAALAVAHAVVRDAVRFALRWAGA